MNSGLSPRLNFDIVDPPTLFGYLFRRLAQMRAIEHL